MPNRPAPLFHGAGLAEGFLTRGGAMSETEPIRVIAVDDHQVVRGGIRYALLDEDGIEFIGEAPDGAAAIRLCEQAQPDVVLMDLMMPEMDGVETTRAIRERCPQVQILVLTSFHDKDLVPRAMQAGAIGYLLKGVSNRELVEAIRAAHAGKSILAKEAMAALIQAAAPAPKLGDDLSEREREVLALLSQGLSNKEIAERLFLSVATIKYHVRLLLSKLGASSRAEAVALAWQHDLIEE
jgi:NarL family two-component system response regulator LiaR